MNATHLMALDLRKKKDLQETQSGVAPVTRSVKKGYIQFDNVFALNPPFSNVYGSTAIDTLVKESWIDPHEAGWEAIYNAAIELLRRKMDASMLKSFVNVRTFIDGFHEDLKKGGFTREQLRYFGGLWFCPHR